MYRKLRAYSYNSQAVVVVAVDDDDVYPMASVAVGVRFLPLFNQGKEKKAEFKIKIYVVCFF